MPWTYHEQIHTGISKLGQNYPLFVFSTDKGWLISEKDEARLVCFVEKKRIIPLFSPFFICHISEWRLWSRNMLFSKWVIAETWIRARPEEPGIISLLMDISQDGSPLPFHPWYTLWANLIYWYRIPNTIYRASCRFSLLGGIGYIWGEHSIEDHYLHINGIILGGGE